MSKKKTKKFLECSYDDIGRKYHFDDGSWYYSVTTMLGHTKDKRFLEEWKERVGHKRAEGLTRIAGVIGTDMHECLELYLTGLKPEFPNAVVKNLFLQIKPHIDKKVIRVHKTEQFLYSDSLKLAGTVDGIVEYLMKGNLFLSVLDFKTANKQPKIEWIKDYFLQITAYAIMIKEIYGIFPQKGVLLFAYKQLRSRYNEFVIDTSNYIDSLHERNAVFQQSI